MSDLEPIASGVQPDRVFPAQAECILALVRVAVEDMMQWRCSRWETKRRCLSLLVVQEFSEQAQAVHTVEETGYPRGDEDVAEVDAYEDEEEAEAGTAAGDDQVR